MTRVVDESIAVAEIQQQKELQISIIEELNAALNATHHLIVLLPSVLSHQQQQNEVCGSILTLLIDQLFPSVMDSFPVDIVDTPSPHRIHAPADLHIVTSVRSC